MNKKRLPILVLVLAALGTGLYFTFRGNRSANEATLYGNVDIREVSLAFRVGGRVADIKVDEGSVVHAGDLIASLDPEPLQDSVHTAEAALAALAARNAMLHKGYRSEDVAQAQARLEAARAALKDADFQLARQKVMVPDGAAPQRTLDSAQSVRDQAAANSRAAEENLRELSAGYRREEVAESDGLLAQAQANLETARLALKDARLTAPSDGVILTRAVEKGSMVQAGGAGFSLTLTSPVWARVYVNETQLGRFNSGTKVTLHTDLHPEKAYHGVVGFVSPTAEFTPKTVETADLRTSLIYRLRVVVEDADSQLRQGMPVTVRLAQ